MEKYTRYWLFDSRHLFITEDWATPSMESDVWSDQQIRNWDEAAIWLHWSLILTNVNVGMIQLAGVGILVLSIWLLFDQALLFAAKGALNYQTGTYILLITGALMTIIGFLGCCGALRESQCLLGTVIMFSLSLFLSLPLSSSLIKPDAA